MIAGCFFAGPSICCEGRLLTWLALGTGSSNNNSRVVSIQRLSKPCNYLAHKSNEVASCACIIGEEPGWTGTSGRVIKAPRLFLCDTGLAAFLAGPDSEADPDKVGLRGPLLETLILNDSLAWRETMTPRPDVLYWRTASGAGVDFVIERAGTVVPVEVKANSRPRSGDATHLRLFGSPDRSALA